MPQEKKSLSYEGGIPSGEWALFYANSNSKQEANWDKGVLSGSWTEWYADGQKKIEGEIEDGLAIGVWTEWYADGTKSFEGTRKRSVKKEKLTIWNEKIQRSITVSYTHLRAHET